MVTNFETNKGKFAFVNLFKENVKIVNPLSIEYLHVEVLNCFLFELKDDKVKNFKTIGFVKDLTEEQWENVINTRIIRLSLDHAPFMQYFDYVGKLVTKLSAKESGESLLKSLELTSENLILIKYV
jgi:hypothetical protein